MLAVAKVGIDDGGIAMDGLSLDGTFFSIQPT